MVSSKNVKVSQKRCLGTSIECFTGSYPSEQITDFNFHTLEFSAFLNKKLIFLCNNKILSNHYSILKLQQFYTSRAKYSIDSDNNDRKT